MTTQPRALYLAEILQSEPGAVADAAAEELRRLHSVNAELLEALSGIVSLWDHHASAHGDGIIYPLHAAARAAIKKAEGT